jgi:hypothetical protein
VFLILARSFKPSLVTLVLSSISFNILLIDEEDDKFSNSFDDCGTIGLIRMC